MTDVVAALRRLGLTQYEARAYIALLKSPKVTGYELSKQSGVPQSKVYEVVEKLLQKQIVVSIEEGGIARYIPLDPSEVMARYRRQFIDAVDLLDDELRSIYTSDHSKATYVFSLTHAANILAKAVDMIGAASQEIYLAVWSEEMPSIRPALRAAQSRGIAIGISFYGHEDPGVGVVYHHDTTDNVRVNQGARRMVLVADHEQALVAYFPTVGDATAHWSENIGFIQMTKDYIRHDIWMIRIVADFEPSISEKYGPNRDDLRNIFFGSEDQQTRSPSAAQG